MLTAVRVRVSTVIAAAVEIVAASAVVLLLLLLLLLLPEGSESRSMSSRCGGWAGTIAICEGGN